ncbi:unnamed protein product [Victoria cruziana]
MSWLLNSMESSIAEGFLFLDSTKEIWEAVSEIYGEKENVARIYQLQQDLVKTVKGDRVFHVYLNQLKGIWDELRQHRAFTTDMEVIKRRYDEDRVFKLLAGLGKDFKNLQSSVLLMQPVPAFNTVCAMVQREETRRKVMQEDTAIKATDENSSQMAFSIADGK